jgi:penicillin-binding protein 2
MPKPITIKDHYRETRIFNNRSILALLVVILLTVVLVTRMVLLQIMQYEVHSTKSDRNRINVQPVTPTRGLIFDRNDTLLAENRASYSVTVTKELAKNLDKSLLILQQLLALEDDDLDRFQKRFQRRRRPYEAVPLKFNLNEEEIARVAVNQYRLPGIDISADLVRHYPHGEATSHVIGYVGRINEKEEQSIDQNNYAGTHHIGKIGLEKFYEDDLHGNVGLQRVETNARGRILRILDEAPPSPGSNLKLYMDLPTQQAAVRALGNKRGAVVALDPNTGGILAFVSTPVFDPNLFVTGIDFKTYNKLNTSSDRPLFNRARPNTRQPS